MVTRITPHVVAGLYRVGWRTYELQAHRRVLATLHRRGIVHTVYDVHIGDRRLTAVLHWGGEVDVTGADGGPVAHSANLARDAVDVRIEGRDAVRFVRSGWRVRWTAHLSDHAALHFEPHPVEPGQPIVTVEREGDAEIRDDPLLIVVGTCLVLAHQSLTTGLAAGSTVA